MSVYVDLTVKLVSADRGQAFAKIVEPRKRDGGTEYVTIAEGTSGLLSGVQAKELMVRAARDAVHNLTEALNEAVLNLKEQGLV